tara:strand:- start:4223 stop:4444 length:222 start_codon:yes stop_codon:yes gene_type:complete
VPVFINKEPAKPRDYAAKAKSEKVSVLALKVSAFLQSHAALCLARFSFFTQSKPLRPHVLYSMILWKECQEVL